MSCARIELKLRNVPAALKLLKHSEDEVPAKQKSLVLIETSKVHEYLKDLTSSRELMAQACESAKQDWKVYLEHITMEMRNGNAPKAFAVARESLLLFSCTGRLWAALVQLHHSTAESLRKHTQFKAFLLALREVPKSGEVWCEGGRIRMNPFTQFYDLQKAEEYLRYAMQFTPQYGDSFIEMLRLYTLQGKYEQLGDLKRLCVNADPNYGTLWLYCQKSAHEGPREVWARASLLISQELIALKGVYESPSANLQYEEYMWTGLVQVNKMYMAKDEAHENNRWKLIFGTDAISL